MKPKKLPRRAHHEALFCADVSWLWRDQGEDGGGGVGGLAFFVRLRALDAAGRDVLPARWSDNFITLLPGPHLQEP